MLDGDHKRNHCVTIRCSVELINDRRPELSLAVPTRLASISQLSRRHVKGNPTNMLETIVLKYRILWC